MNAPPQASLEYAPRIRGVPNRVVWKSLWLLLLFFVTFLVLLPDLHNLNPYWRVWILAAPVSTYYVIRMTSFDRAPVRALFIFLLMLVLWIVAACAIYGTFTGVDPHTLTRANYRCANNLHALGEWLDIYAKGHGGRYPDRLEQLLDPDDTNGFPLPPEILVAPFSRDVPAAGPTTQEVMSQAAQRGHCSYVYLGKGLTSACLPNTVLLYEPLVNHADNIKGVHFLVAGGLTVMPVPFLPERKARHLIEELESGHNPPPPQKLR